MSRLQSRVLDSSDPAMFGDQESSLSQAIICESDVLSQNLGDLLYAWYLHQPDPTIIFVTCANWERQQLVEELIDEFLAEIERTKYIKLFMSDHVWPLSPIDAALEKKEIYKKHIEGKYEIFMVIEQEAVACQMYAELGLNVMKVIH